MEFSSLLDVDAYEAYEKNAGNGLSVLYMVSIEYRCTVSTEIELLYIICIDQSTFWHLDHNN